MLASASLLPPRRFQAKIARCESLVQCHAAFKLRMCGTCTKFEHTPRARNRKLALTTPCTRIQGPEGTTLADNFEFCDSPVDHLDPVPPLRWNNVIEGWPSIPQCAPSTVPGHPSVSSTNPNPITRNFDAAGFQESDQEEPAKEKVCHIRCLEPAVTVA